MPHPKDGKNQLDFQIQKFMINLLKKKIIKKSNILEARLAVTGEFVFLIVLIDSKGKIFEVD